jgi:hypothetical protein
MTRRRLLGAGAAVATLLLLTGCNLASRIVVQPDGSGSYSVTMSVPSGGSNAGRTLYQTARTQSANSAIPVTVSPYTSGHNSGFTSTFDFKSLADLEAESQAMAAAQGGALAVTINRDASGWHFTSSAANLLAPSTAFGSAANGSTGGPISGTSLQSVLSVSVVLTLPRRSRRHQRHLGQSLGHHLDLHLVYEAGSGRVRAGGVNHVRRESSFGGTELGHDETGFGHVEAVGRSGSGTGASRAHQRIRPVHDLDRSRCLRAGAGIWRGGCPAPAAGLVPARPEPRGQARRQEPSSNGQTTTAIGELLDGPLFFDAWVVVAVRADIHAHA